jgi:hypothetical protein
MSNVIYVKPSAGNQEDRIALWSRILGIVDVDAWPDYWTLGEKEVEQVINIFNHKSIVLF